MGKKISLKAAIRIINDALMEEDGRPEPKRMPSESVVTLGGRLKGGSNWRVTTVISKDADSLSVSVQLPGGPKGYSTDILNEFADEDTVRKYAIHALTTIYKRNGWTLTDAPKYREYLILNTETSAWEKEKFHRVEDAEAYMKARRMSGYIISEKKPSVTIQRDFSK